MLIAFTGLAGCGKSTAAQYLIDKYNFTRVNFKTAMIAEIKEKWPDYLKAEAERNECTIDDLFAYKPGTFRQFMQNYGTNVRRVDNPEYWVNKWKEVSQNVTPLVVDDVRFINEAEAVDDKGGTIIRIIREGQGEAMNHISEQEMSKIIPDRTISVREGDLESLYKELDVIFETYESQ